MHYETKLAMANIMRNTENSHQNSVLVRVLPFEEYIKSISDPTERRLLFDKLKSSIGILSDATLWRYRSGGIRPNILQRRQIANIIRRHSGDSRYTADNLFPVEFYK